MKSVDIIRQYKKRIALQNAFEDQSKKPTHGQGTVKEKYWFSPDGEIFPVEREHGDQTLTIAREREMIAPDKSIADYGFKSKWELALGLFLNKGWLRVQVYEAKTVGLNGKISAFKKKSTMKAVYKVLPKAQGFFFQENWPCTLEYRSTAKDFKKNGWKKMIEGIRQSALQAKRKEMAEIFRVRFL